MSSPYLITRDRFIHASAEDIFAVLARPALHSVIDGSETVRGEQPNGPDRLYLGAEFGMDMRMGLKYKILNRVVEFEEGRRISWCHFSKATWTYTLVPDGEGTMVTEEWDARSVPWKFLLKPLGFTRRHPTSMEKTLAKLEDYVTAG